MKLTPDQVKELEVNFNKGRDLFNETKVFTEIITGIQVDLQNTLSDSIKAITLNSHTKAKHFFKMLQIVLKRDHLASPLTISIRMKLLPTKFDQFNLHQNNDLFVYKIDKYLAASMDLNTKDFEGSVQKFCDGIDQLLVIYCTNKVQ